MNRPRVVHCKKEPFDVYIGRSRPWEGLVGDWGNPFSHKEVSSAQFKVETVEEAVARHKEWFLSQPDLVARARRELRGKVLGCWGCKPCHGDVLVQVANEDVNTAPCVTCGVEVYLGPPPLPLGTAPIRCSPCSTMHREPLFAYACMYKDCGRTHRFIRGSVIPETSLCGHGAPLRVAVGSDLAHCIHCGVELELRTLEFYDQRQWPLCSACAPKAPKLGTWDRVEAKHEYIIGLDEVGWGALAGPLMVGAVAVPRGWRWPGLRDSKDMSAVARGRIVTELSQRMVGKIFVHIETMLVREFERFDNAEQALLETHRRAAEKMLTWVRAHLDDHPLVIVDGNRPVPGVRCMTIKNADDFVPAVMTAAIFAKVRRDRYMLGLHHAFPVYGFADSAGYGTDQHREAIKKYGPCPAHRRNYQPVKGMVASTKRRRMQQLPLLPV